MQHIADAVTGKAATSVTVLSALAGLTITEVAAIVALVVGVLQIIILAPKAYAVIRDFFKRKHVD